MPEEVTVRQVEDALDSVPATDDVVVVQVQEDGSLRKFAERDGVPNYPGHMIVLNGREEAAAIFKRAASQARGRASRPDPAPERGDQPTPDESPRGRRT